MTDHRESVTLVAHCRWVSGEQRGTSAMGVAGSTADKETRDTLIEIRCGLNLLAGIRSEYMVM